MNKILGLRHCGIICKNINKSLFFYKNILGLKIIQDFWDDSQYINKISNLKRAKVHMIKLKLNDKNILELLEYKTHPTKSFKLPIINVGLCHLALKVDDIEKTYKWLKKNKIKVLSKPVLSSEKFAKVFFCLDPDGVRIELVEIL